MFNKTHPEALPGEIWVSNDAPDAMDKGLLILSGWRGGVNAYDIEGNIIVGLIPLFMKVSTEYKEEFNLPYYGKKPI